VNLTMYRFRFNSNVTTHTEYATGNDFCKSFADDLQPLYLLAFLLTGTHTDAERCFVATVEDAYSANDVFKGWEHSWSKRRLIINAIRLVFSAPTEKHGKPDSWCPSNAALLKFCEVDALARLIPPFQRFVFVMCVLERYSERECALLLGRTPRDVVEARLLALWQLSGFSPAVIKAAG
jgi:hypothetical protein